MRTAPQDAAPHGRREETRLFIFLIVFLFPILSVALVSGFGFVVWILQMIFGPPGPSN
jgi:nitrate reductase NapE